jgi:hypothetical protein
MATHSLLTKLYRTAYLVGVALLIASVALLTPVAGIVSPASAQTGWFLTLYCTSFDLDTPEHPAIEIRAQFRAPGETSWDLRQEWSLPAGGPATYSFDFNPVPVPGSEALIRVFDADTNQQLFGEKQDLSCDGPTPTNTTPPEEPTPTNTTPPEPTPTNTTPPEPTPTNTTPPEEPTPTNTTPPGEPTPTNTTPPEEPTPTPTDVGSIPTPTNTTPPEEPSPTPTFGVSATPTATTPGDPTPTPTDVGSIPTPTNTAPPNDPTSTPGSGPIPSPVPQGTPSVLIPVTGLDSSFAFTFLQRTLMNLGFGFLGLGLVLHGLSLGGRKKE